MSNIIDETIWRCNACGRINSVSVEACSYCIASQNPRTAYTTWTCKRCGFDIKLSNGSCGTCGFGEHGRIDDIENRLARLEDKDKPLISYGITLRGDISHNMETIHSINTMLKQNSKFYHGFTQKTNSAHNGFYITEVIFTFKDRQ